MNYKATQQIALALLKDMATTKGIVFITKDGPSTNAAENNNCVYYRADFGYAKIVYIAGTAIYTTMAIRDSNPSVGAVFKEMYAVAGNAFVIDITVMAAKIASGLKPVASLNGGKSPQLKYEQKQTPHPILFAIFEIKVCSYLGNYGAGKTLNTFTLLPGEKTTISVRTYKDITSTNILSSNVVEGNFQAATDQLENTLQQQQGYQSSSGTNTYGSNLIELSTSLTNAFGSGVKTGSSNFVSQSMAAYLSNFGTIIESSMNQHANESNSFRNIQINSTTAVSVSEGEETSLVRVLENTNWSRTLNFVFRQLLQEYHIISWIKDISFMVTNGNQPSNMSCHVWDLESMLKKAISPADVADVLESAINYLCHLPNFNGDMKQFFKEVTYTQDNCVGTGDTSYTIWQKDKDLTDTYSVDGFEATVPGVILGGQTIVLKTDSVIADSLLGQGEALDCYNQNLQAEAVRAAMLNNDKLQMALDTITAITDPKDKAEAYRRMFGECCEKRTDNTDVSG